MVTLRPKFHGCIAGSWVGSAMGAAVEGWSRERIKETHGFLDRLVGYRHYTSRTDWQRLPGTTEDGIERQKLIGTAIIEKQDRIQAHDLVAVWLRDLDPAKMVYKQEPFDGSLVELAKAGVPASELGRLWPFPNVVSVARASHPLGLINAGDPRGAADNSFEVGKVYSGENTPALRWAALYNAAIAEACKPQATVASVLDVARRFAGHRAQPGSLQGLYDTVERDVNHAVELAVFAITGGNPKAAILAAVNFGRDTDCLAAVAGGLSGALAGVDAIPEEWIAQVDEATLQDPYTNNHRTIEETADGLFSAFLARQKRLSDYLGLMGEPDYLR